MKRLFLCAFIFFLILTCATAVTVPFLPNDVVIPTQPEFQNDPLKCHGLAYALAKLASNGEPLEVYRVAGPSDSFPGQNSGPYIIRSNQIADLKQYIKNFVSSNPQFSNVSFDYLGNTVNVDVRLIAVIKPLKTCVVDGAFDKPSKVFSLMGIPTSSNINDCIPEKGLIVFGCKAMPPYWFNYKDFIAQGGTVVTTDLIGFILSDEYSIQCGNTGTGGFSSIWEGKSKGSFDLPVELKKFFQPPKETMTNWYFMSGTFSCNLTDSRIKVLASGDYYPSKPFRAFMVEHGKGRYFYFAFHIVGGGSTEQAAVMSSLYAGALASKLNVFPMNCDDEAMLGETKKLCKHAEVNNHSFMIWPSLEPIENVKIKIKLDGSEVSWITPSENNFDLESPKYIDLSANVPNNFSIGEHNVEIRFESDNATAVVVNGKLTIKGIPNKPPVAAFSNCPNGTLTVKANKPFELDASASYDPDGDPIQYSWDLGTGAFGAYEATVAKTIVLASDATVRLKVFDGTDESSPAKCDIIVQPNNPPKAIFKAIPKEGIVPLTVDFYASQSYDPDNDPITYKWTFSDRPDVKTEEFFSLVFNEPKPVDVTLTVTDSFGASDSVTQKVYPYEIATIHELILEDKNIGHKLKVSVTCTHDLDVNLKLYSFENAELKKIAEAPYVCNSGVIELGPELKKGIYFISAKLTGDVKCAKCEAETYFNVKPEIPGLPVPDLEPFMAFITAIIPIIIIRRGR